VIIPQTGRLPHHGPAPPRARLKPRGAARYHAGGQRCAQAAIKEPTLPDLVLSALYRYPVKSLRGQGLDALDVGPRGPLADRQWMVVDADGRFLTQRQLPRMCLVETELDAGGGLHLRAPGMPELAVAAGAGGRVAVRVWSDHVTARPAGPDADRWLSEFLDTDCRLVRFADDVVRPVDPDYARPGDQVGFADGFPFLLISESSLADLNGRLERPIEMRRFRPNLVVSGCAPHAEDGWRRIRIGQLRFRVAKPCARCIIPTIDIDTGERADEPLRTLMTYRRRDNKILFGQNLVHDGEGRLAVGMPVEVLD
jgi:uncharacterized protein YcbX